MSVLRSSVHFISKHLVYWALFIAIGLTLLIATASWLSAAIEERQSEIAEWLGDKIGYPVNIEQAGLYWLDFKPKLQLESLKILEQDGITELLSLNQLYFGLDLIASIKQQEPVFNDITLSGLDMTLVRNELGQVQIQGFENLSSEPEGANNINWLLSIRLFDNVNLHAINVNYIDNKSALLSGAYQLKNITIGHKKENLKIRGELSLPSTLGDGIQFQMQGKLNGDEFDNVTWTMQAEVKNMKLQPLVGLLNLQDITLQQGKLNTTLSVSGVGDHISSVQGQLNLEQVELVTQQRNTKKRPVLINELSGTFNWQQTAASWQLSGDNIQIEINDDRWPATHFMIEKTGETWSLASDYIRLSDLTSIALLTALSPEKIRQQKPAGDIEKLTIQYSSQQGLSHLEFQLRDGALLPWQSIPGVTGLTASVNWHDGRGLLELDSHEITLYPEAWLDDSVFFDSIKGVVRFQKKINQSWKLYSQELRVWNDDLSLQLDGSIEKKTDGRIINDLSLQIEELIVNNWTTYIPQRTFNKSFKEWVNKAFPAGKIIDGTIIWQGDIASFPYEKSSEKGRFDLMLQVEDVQLHYADGWPDLFNINAVITGHGNDLSIKSKSGNVAGFDFENVTTIITKLTEKGPNLIAEAEIKGTTKKALQFLLDSPLKQRFGRVVKTVKATGKSDIYLKLEVPLADVEETLATGTVSFIDSVLYDESLAAIKVSKINGELAFSNTGISADTITAELFNSQIEIDVKPENEPTIISISGNVAMTELQSIWSYEFPSYISGEADYQINLTVLERALGDFYLDTKVSSNLVGIELAVPEPLAKVKNQARLLTARLEHIENNLAYSIEYGELMNAIVMTNDDLWRGELRFGVGKAQLPKSGIRVRGQLAALSIDDWLDWSGSQQDDDSQLLGSLDDVSVEIATLSGFGQQLTQLNMSALKDAQGWRINLHSDQSTGTIYMPIRFDNLSILKVDLDKVSFSIPKDNDEGDLLTETMEEQSSVNLWPAMDIKIGSLIVNDIPLGKLRAIAHQQDQFWLLDSASISSDIFTATVSEGSWMQQGLNNQSHIKIEAKSDDLAALLEKFHYQPAVDAENILLTMDISWPDSPLGLARHNVQGLLTIDVGKGKLKEVEPGAAGRIFGLLSVTAIPKRLSLDFNDLFGEGFSFDSILGTFDLANGMATTENMTLKAPSATIEIAGPIDLVNQRYKQKVKIRPNVASALPFAGAVAGGPIGLAAGAAILLFDKVAGTILGTEIVNLISYSYDLTGAWDDPQLNVSAPETH
ncbi:MAG: TIGR02099 family protein [Piscirickettsiaceae bacterium]|nr:TIGR02099 family protein [Piscirickettsiaceae bacterium]